MRLIKILLAVTLMISFLILSGCKGEETGGEPNETASIRTVQQETEDRAIG
jgi:hypothetical protein